MPLKRLLPMIALFLLLALPRIGWAAPTQEEVFKSIQDNVGSSTDSRKFVLFLCVSGGVIIVLCIFSQREKREVAPKALNHQGKLLKEIMKSVPVRPREIKQLKTLAEQTALPGGDTVQSPLTLLLCPSVMSKAVQNPRSKADRRVIQQVLRKTVMAKPTMPAAPDKKRSAPLPPREKPRRVPSGKPLSDPRRL